MKKQDRRAMLEFQQNRMMPAMGGMYRQQMFPNMYMPLMPSMYPYMRQPMFARQPQYPRTFHRQNQGRRTNKQPQQPQQPQMPMQMQPQIQQQPIAPQVAQRPVEVPAAPEVVDKQQIGEQIYSRIMQMYVDDQNLWGKLTGMLLESIPLPELQSLLANQAQLTEKIHQAKDYYDNHMPEIGKQ